MIPDGKSSPLVQTVSENGIGFRDFQLDCGGVERAVLPPDPIRVDVRPVCRLPHPGYRREQRMNMQAPQFIDLTRCECVLEARFLDGDLAKRNILRRIVRLIWGLIWPH